MKKKQAVEGIDFADSEYLSLNMSEDRSLILYLKLWNEERLRLVFLNVIQFSYKLGDVIKDLYEVLDESSLNQAILSVYPSISPKRSYKLFQLEDIDDIPFIQVVAESVTVFKE